MEQEEKEAMDYGDLEYRYIPNRRQQHSTGSFIY